MKIILKEMLQNLINGDEETATEKFHEYTTAKSRVMLGLVQENQVKDELTEEEVDEILDSATEEELNEVYRGRILSPEDEKFNKENPARRVDGRAPENEYERKALADQLRRNRAINKAAVKDAEQAMADPTSSPEFKKEMAARKATASKYVSGRASATQAEVKDGHANLDSRKNSGFDFAPGFGKSKANLVSTPRGYNDKPGAGKGVK